MLPPSSQGHRVTRYFFNILDGTATRDLDGTDLPDIYVAQAEAIRLAGEILRDMGGRFWNDAEWRLEVSDESGQVLFVLRFSAEERLPKPVPRPSSETGPHPGSSQH